jgi:hypothetical protein
MQPIAGSVSPEQLIGYHCAAPDPGLVSYRCLNGPCQDRDVEAPRDATPGTACALHWTTPARASRYAVYLLVDLNGQRGLMYLQSYTKPSWAQAKVQRLTLLCAEMMS